MNDEAECADGGPGEMSTDISRRPRTAPSLIDVTFVLWAIAVPFGLGNRLFNADGDATRHLAMGEFILRGGPFQIDALAYTKTGPFLTTEWLSQLTYGLAWRVGGLTGVIVLVGLLLATTYALVVAFLRRSRVDPLLAFGVGLLAACMGAAHWVARPHVFTLLGFAALLHLASFGTMRRVWVFAPFFLLWANFHAGFILGVVVLLVIAAGELGESIVAAEPTRGAEWLERARYHAFGAVIGLIASVVNPQGVGLLLRIGGILTNSYLLEQSVEFSTLDFHATYGRLVLVVLVSTIGVLALRRERPALPRLFVILLLLAGAFYAGRNAPIFGLVALPLLAIEMDGAWRRLGSGVVRRMRQACAAGEQAARPGRWSALAVVPMLIIMLSHGRLAGRQVLPNEFDGRRFPVAAVETAREAGLDGNMFNWFIWGGYILKAWPEQKIFMDGMTDFFGNELLRTYLTVDRLEHGWGSVLDRYDVSLVIVPPHVRLARALRDTGAWSVWYEDDTAVILQRIPPSRSAGDERAASSRSDVAITHGMAR